MTVKNIEQTARDQSLAGKVALVTGAASGIGFAIAQRFLREGAKVWMTDLQKKILSISSLNEHARTQVLDVREEDHWKRVIEMVEQRDGQLHILINNAGITGLDVTNAPLDPEHCSLADWRAVHATNLDGVFLGCRAAIHSMRRQGRGSIINISSRSGLVGIPGAAAYASSKAAVRNHTKSVALWCAQQRLKVRCNSIHPAAILTPMWESMLGTGPERQARLEAIENEIPLRRFGSVEEVASMALFLASDESSYVTGAEFSIDGGILAGSIAGPS